MNITISVLFFLSVFSVAMAAPLDNLFLLDPEKKAGSTGLSIAVDRVNDTLDVLGIRAQDEEFSGTTVGDYQGYSGYVDVTLWQGISLNTAMWKRKIDLGSETKNITTWKLGGQWKIFSQKHFIPSLGLRYQYWKNNAGDMNNKSSRTLLNITVDEINITNVNDVQHQIDLVASWVLRPRLLVNFFWGMGFSEVNYDQFLVKYKGCRYSLASPSTDTVVLKIAQEITNECQISRVKRRDSKIRLPGPGLGVSYYSTYQQLGSAFSWGMGRWMLKGGMRAIWLDRDVDDFIGSQGSETYEMNYIGLLTLGFGVTKHIAIFARGQYYHQNWGGEIPLTYNVFSSRQFAKSYGLLSAGLSVNF